MKKIGKAACALVCAAFLCACAAGQEGTADRNGADREKTDGTVNVPEETAVPDEGRTDNTQQKVTSDDGQDTSSAARMQGLMQGDLGGIGAGILAYALPEQDGEDYKLCFFEEDGQVSDFWMSMSKADYYPLEMADYIFPDVRENNVSIGKFIEIYFFDTVTIDEDGTSGLAVVASYDVNGETCYDTRIYRWNGTGYSTEEQMMQEFNEQYSNTQDYPVEALYYLSSETAS
ncbi:MAG: hypothetical protein K2N80_02130 [Lachnospiraceae bacterium]|nr:hypothetical protein [Lachnospiraceae bacterium]